MSQTTLAESLPLPRLSALVLSDRLLTLAENADRAGYKDTADRLVRLAHRVFEEPRRRATSAGPQGRAVRWRSSFRRAGKAPT